MIWRCLRDLVRAGNKGRLKHPTVWSRRTGKSGCPQPQTHQSASAALAISAAMSNHRRRCAGRHAAAAARSAGTTERRRVFRERRSPVNFNLPPEVAAIVLMGVQQRSNIVESGTARGQRPMSCDSPVRIQIVVS